MSEVSDTSADQLFVGKVIDSGIEGRDGEKETIRPGAKKN